MREKSIDKETIVYAVDEIVGDVRVILDLNDESEQFLDDDDVETLTLNDIIESKIVDAAKYMLRYAPLRLCGQGRSFGGEIAWDSHRTHASGYVQLPADFLRLISFQMSDWQSMVRIAITEDDATYAQQHGDFAGLKGNPEKPVVAIVEYPTGLALEFFSCRNAQAAIKRAIYIPVPSIKERNDIESDADAGEDEGVLIATSGKTIDLPSKLLKAIEYYAAYLTSMTIRETDANKIAMLKAEAYGAAEMNVE